MDSPPVKTWEARAIMTTPTDSSRTHILIVEDEIHAAADLERRLAKMGHEICGTATTCEDALEQVALRRPDLVMMDITLEGGMDAASILRDRWDVPVVFLATHEDTDQLERAGLTGHFNYLLKPFRDRDLRIAIDMALYVGKVESDRRKAALALERSERNYRLLADNADDVIFTLDMDLRYTYVSPSVWKLRGFTASEVMGQDLSRVLTPDSLRAAHRMISEELEAEARGEADPHRSRTVELEMLRKDGSTVWTEVKCSFLRDEDGKTSGILGVTRDISDRMKAESLLRRKAGQLEALFDSSLSLIMIKDRDFRFLQANKRFLESMGIREDELAGKTDYDLFPKELADYFRKGDQKIMETGEPLISQDSVTIQGEFRHFHGVRTPLFDAEGRVEAICVVTTDITDLKRTEADLRESEGRFQKMLALVPDMISIHDPEMNIIYSNWRGFGAVPESKRVRYTKCYRTYRGYDDICPDCRARTVLESGEIFQEEALLPDGRWVDVRVIPLLDEQGRVELFMEWVRDITESKEAEAALKEKSKELELFFSNAIELLCIADTDGYFRRLNPEWERALGYTLAELEGRRFLDLVHPDDLEETLKAISTLSKGQTIHNFTNRYRHKDGTYRWIEWRSHPDGRLIYAAARDITDRKLAEEETARLQAQLQQAQKMEAVGTLAGGVAHDFNNLLQAITGYAQMLLMDKDEKDPAYTSVSAILKAGRRAADLVRQLLLYSRKAETERRPLELNREVEQTRRIMERTLPKMVDIAVHTKSRLWKILADPVQIEQILLNLGTNAADAMPEGGRLTIETENVTLDRETAQDHLDAKPGRYVLLTVSDTGHGMEEETIPKIFDPFFTTKEVGKGTGLGLASVYGIVKGHGGHILCTSETGLGTTFKIYLPAAEEQADTDPEGTSAGTLPGGTETILVVDDEKSIRSIASQILRKFGYRVLTAATGEKALELYAAGPDDIDLVIMDIGMPGMGGHRCLQEIIRMNPAARILIASGYSFNGEISDALKAGAIGYVGKPYQLDDLLGKVRAVLEKQER